MDNVIVTGTEVIPLTSLLVVTSPAVLSDEGLGGPQALPISNAGGAALNISSVTTDGSGDFATISNITFGPLLGIGGNGTINFDFAPGVAPVAGLYTTNLTVVSDDPSSPTIIATVRGGGYSLSVDVRPEL